MPTYEYRCKDCGDELEAVQAFTDDPLTECPSCGGNLKKRFGSVGISFKGSGFYKNDSRPASTTGSGSKSPDTSTSDGSTSDGGKSDGGGSDSGSPDSASPSKSADTATAGKSDSGKPTSGKSAGGKSKETAST